MLKSFFGDRNPLKDEADSISMTVTRQKFAGFRAFAVLSALFAAVIVSAEELVDETIDSEPAVVVQQATVGIDRAEDPHPELDIRQQLGRTRENFPGNGRAACKAEREEQNRAYPGHLDLFRRAA
jgi:hypothetical protein